MLVRQKRRFTDLCAALLAVIGVLLFAFAAPGTHQPNLHSVTASQIVSQGAHAHDDHSHDGDDDVAVNDTGDHHHADHTHEKAGLFTSAGAFLRTQVPTAFSASSISFAGSPPDGIHRPPRILR
jgi:ABC-type nickel/cobalt efflux system permease component RcnA